MIKTLLVLCAVFAAAKGEYYKNFRDLGYDYINLNRHQYAKVLQDYDAKLDHFTEHYLGRLEGIKIQLDMVTANIVQTEDVLNPLELLSDFHKKCVVEHRSTVPSVSKTTAAITRCISEASAEEKRLMTNAIAYRNLMQKYYKNNFESDIDNCNQHAAEGNYTSCITSTTTRTNEYTIENQKNFETELEAAECAAKANIKKALDCSYTSQTRTITKIAEANLLIKRCIAGEDQCTPCDDLHTCRNEKHLEVDYNNKFIENPFYQNPVEQQCFILRNKHA